MKQKSIKVKLLTMVIVVVAISIAIATVTKATSDILMQNKIDTLLINQAKDSAEVFVSGQTEAVNEQLVSITEKMTRAAAYAEYVYQHPEEFVSRHNKRPSEFSEKTKGITFHWSAFTEKDIDNEEIIAEADLLSALESEFYSLKNTCPMIQSLYVATESHINIGYDENVLAKVGSFYSPIEANAQWFLKPLNDGEIYISDAYQDSFGRGLTVTVSAPYKVNGKLHGVIGADITIQNIEKNILDIDMTEISGEAVLLAADASPISAKGLTEETKTSDILGSNSDRIVKDMSKKQSNILETQINDSNKYIVYNTIETTGWKLAIILSEDDIIAPTAVIDKLIINISIVSIAVFVLLFVIMIIVINYLCKKFTAPILKLTNDVAQIGNGNLDYSSDIDTGDEIELLSKSFEKMTDDLKKHIDNLTRITAENERIGAELNVATHIQASMLPCIFPAFPDRDEFDIFASMNPAKEVGGDFYDYFMVDDTHIAIVMADVSGKGVPAALFMVIAKTLIKDHTALGKSLGEIFSDVNEILCESNSGEMFVTAFEGVLDIVTGEFTFVNAGHEMPFICKVGGDFEPYKIRPGFVLAGMEGMVYKGGSITLEPGDKIFQYTDGVTEATDKNEKLFGMERLAETLNKNKDKTPDMLLPAVKADIDAFVGEAPQFDDITMLCLEYKKRGTSKQ